MATTSGTVDCAACGRSNAPDALFCAGCAAPLACAACGNKLEAGAAFCTRCGRPAGRRPDRSLEEASIVRPIGRRVEQTPHLRLFVQTGSFADQQAAGVGARLEALLAALNQLLGLPPPDAPISVYLVEVLNDPARPGATLASGSYAVPERREIWSVFRSDAPGIDLERALARVLIAVRTGVDPASAPLLLDGMVGLAVQALGALPPADQLNAMLAGALATGTPIAVQPLLAGPTEQTMQFYPVVATAFGAFLLAQRGPETMLSLLGAYDPANPDAAFRRVYGQSLGTLEKHWLQALRKAGPNVGGIGKFLRTSLIYLRPYRWKQAEIILYIIFGIAFSQALPQAQRYLIDNALPHPLVGGGISSGSTTVLFTMLGIGVLLFFVMAATSLRQNYLSAQVGEGVMRDLRTRMFNKLQDLSASYYSRTSTGDIISRMSNDLFAVEFALTGAILQGLVLILTFFASLGSLLYLDWKLTLMALVILPLFYLITRFLGPPASRASLERQEILSSVTGVLQENIAAQPVVRAYNLRRTFIREYGAQLANLYRSAIRLTFLGSLFGLSASLLTTLIQVLVFGIGGYFVIKGQLSLGALVAFLSLLGGLIAPAQSLTGVAQALQQASGAMDRVTGLLEEEPKVADRPDARTMRPLQRDITFDHVWFSYTGAEPQLSDVSFTIPAGAAVAFVGPSGSGKSTVTNLVMRFYDADKGTVSFDGVDVRDFTLDSLRNQVGIVFQDNFLFNRSVRENIRFGREGATDQEVEAAARAAEVHDFILQMPQGYETQVGERGANLSGGQRQRIAIARAILRNPSILILDEATSALDPRTENAINHTLASLAKGRTTISITHRLAAASTADRIYVLDRGRLVEQGTHADLLQAGGLYARLYEDQSGAVSGGVLQLALELDYLRRVPIFSALTGDMLSSLAARLTTERVGAGDAVVEQGTPGNKLYLIVGGEAEVLARDAAGNERQLALLRPGDYFGEIALLYDVPRTATVRARSPLTLYALDREAFLRLLEGAPGMRSTIEQAVAAYQGAQAEQQPRPETAALKGEPVTPAREGSDAAAALFVAPWSLSRPRLVVLQGENIGRSFTLNEQFTGIGRHPANDIVLPDRRVSGYHARIERTGDGRYLVLDSGSTNGTKLNDAPLTQPTELHPGDVLSLGSTALRFESGG